METITFFDEDENKVEFFVVMDTQVNGQTYLLVSEDNPEEGDFEADILKFNGEDEDGMGFYEAVEDDEEYDAIFKVFEELIDGEEE